MSNNTSTKSTTKVVLKRLKAIDKIWHPESTLIFKSLDDKKVIGRFHNNNFIPLDDVALDLCTEWNFSYDPDLVEEVDESSSSVVEEDEGEVEVEAEEEVEVREEKAEEEVEVREEKGEVEVEVRKEKGEEEVEVREEKGEEEVEVREEKGEVGVELRKEKGEEGEFGRCISKLSEMYDCICEEREKYVNLYQKEKKRNEELLVECNRKENELENLKNKFENMKKIFTM